jgi:hypothetical protein
MIPAKNILRLTAVCAVWLFANGAYAQSQPHFSVMGVVIRQDFGLAWIGEPTYTKDNFVRVREGDRIGPYQIVKIREDRVELTGPSGPVVVRVNASAPDTAQQPSGQAVSVPAPVPASTPIPEADVAAARARAREWKTQYPSQGFNRLLERLKPREK